MLTDRIIPLIAIGFCSIAILSAVIVIPKLYAEINEIHNFVFFEVQKFQISFYFWLL